MLASIKEAIGTLTSDQYSRRWYSQYRGRLRQRRRVQLSCRYGALVVTVEIPKAGLLFASIKPDCAVQPSSVQVAHQLLDERSFQAQTYLSPPTRCLFVSCLLRPSPFSPSLRRGPMCEATRASATPAISNVVRRLRV